MKCNFLMKPKNYYKEFFLVQNNDPMIAREQVDVRKLPPYYVHRKIREALERKGRELRSEKERKFRTTL